MKTSNRMQGFRFPFANPLGLLPSECFYEIKFKNDSRIVHSDKGSAQTEALAWICEGFRVDLSLIRKGSVKYG